MDSSKKVQIPLGDLEKIIHLIFENIRETTGQDEISLDVDYYNDISLTEIYGGKIAVDTPDVVFGQLYDDWEFSKRILSSPDEAFPLMLDHVAPLLRYIAFHFLPK